MTDPAWSSPTNQFRVDQNSFFDPLYNLCGVTHETILHTLRDCHKVKFNLGAILGFLLDLDSIALI